MSTHAEILDVHEAESKFRLKPHRHVTRETVRLTPDRDGHLRVSLEELLTPETYAKLREMRLV